MSSDVLLLQSDIGRLIDYPRRPVHAIPLDSVTGVMNHPDFSS